MVLNSKRILISSILFILFWILFLSGPVTQMADSRYSLLLSEHLMETGSFDLTQYFQRPLDPNRHPSLNESGLPYQIEEYQGRLYYYYPPGSSILSIPFVALFKLGGLSCFDQEGKYNPSNEDLMQRILSGFLMALASALVFLYFSNELSIVPSIICTIIFALGTSVWSTGTRALWSSTWGVFLLIVAIILLCQHEKFPTKYWLSSLLGTILAFMFFSRPTFAISMIAIIVILIKMNKKSAVIMFGTLFFWGLLFIFYSYSHYNQFLPRYFYAARTADGNVGESILGSLISPSRGLFFYSPILLLPLAGLLFKPSLIWNNIFVKCALCVFGVHFLLIAVYWRWYWYGGFSYGPRLFFDMIPWFIPMVLGVMKEYSQMPKTGWKRHCIGGIIFIASILSIAQNAPAAFSWKSWQWNEKPFSIDEMKWRLWDWKQPQSLAWLLPASLPPEFPEYSIGTNINPGSVLAHPVLWSGWAAYPEGTFRWTDGQQATILLHFSEEKTPRYFTLRGFPFLDNGRIKSQRIRVFLNGQLLGEKELTETTTILFPVSSSYLTENNIVILELPDASCPTDSADKRMLAIGVEWFKLV